MYYLRLKFQKHRYPAVFVRKMDKEPTIRINTIVFGKTSGIPLVHMNVMNALAGGKIEIFIGCLLRRPFAAKSIDKSAGSRQRLFYPDVKDVVEVIVRSVGGSGQDLQVFKI